MRKRTLVIVAAMVVAVAIAGFQAASASGGKMRFSASLNGYAEIPTLSVQGVGSFSAQVAPDQASISYTLSFSGMSGDAFGAHIHLGQPWVAGGVAAFLCGGGGKPDCPGTGGTVSGTIVAADVVPIPTQGLDTGELEELLAAIRAGATYVNVHTPQFPTGEIRGQIF